MPDSVEMPAPVKATTFPASASIRLRWSTFPIIASLAGPDALAPRGPVGNNPLGDTLARQQRLAERAKQRAVHRIALRIVFCMPLHAQVKPRSAGDADGLDRAILRHALDHDPVARLQNALTMQGVHADGLAAEDARENAARHQPDLVAVGKDNGRVGMDLARLGARHAVVQAAGQLADLVMQRAAERDVHLLKAAADPQDGHATRDA